MFVEESKKEVVNGCFGRMHEGLPLSLWETTMARRGEGGRGIAGGGELKVYGAQFAIDICFFASFTIIYIFVPFARGFDAERDVPFEKRLCTQEQE